MSPTVETIRTEGLGDSTYVLAHGGLAIVVDPQRDIDRFEVVMERLGADLRFVLETHVHNDYVSGGRDLARRHGAELVMPAGAAPVFRHRPAFHYEDIDAGPLTVRPIHTPGHTPEHTSYLVLLEGRQWGVFTGGSLLVGSAGRTDLLGLDRAETLARLQYGSVNRIATLEDHVGLYPTHGAGSFCTSGAAGRSTSTIAVERAANPALAYDGEDAFVKGELSGLVPYPSYYRHMSRLNLIGLPEPDLTVTMLDEAPPGVTVVDTRPRHEFAAGHIPGSLGIELSDSFATWVGWLTEHNTALALVVRNIQDGEEARRQLARIGYDDVRGVIRPNGDATASFRIADVAEVAQAVAEGGQILDVRAPDEWERATITGSVLCYLPDLKERTPPELDPSRPVWVLCASGYRSSTAAGILENRGFEPILLARGGATDVLSATSNRR